MPVCSACSLWIMWCGRRPMVDNRNQLARPDKNDILKKLSAEQHIDPAYQPFGDGHAAEKICEILRETKL